MQNAILKVEGMSCGHCVSAVEKALDNIGVTGKVSLENKLVEVTYDENKIKLDMIKEAIEDQGYDVV